MENTILDGQDLSDLEGVVGFEEEVEEGQGVQESVHRSTDDGSQSEEKASDLVSESQKLGGRASKNLDLLMDIPLDVSVRLGHVRMQVRDLLKLNKGSLIEMEKEADEPLEIHVNDRLLAYGEVVMIKDKLGIRLTDIVSLSERLEQLH